MKKTMKETMKAKQSLMAFAGLLLSTSALANSDSGKIIELYSRLDGAMAVRLNTGLPNSSQDTKCGGTSLDWAGVPATADPSIKSALLSAHAMGKNVELVTFGNCVSNWVQIEAMHIKE